LAVLIDPCAIEVCIGAAAKVTAAAMTLARAKLYLMISFSLLDAMNDHARRNLRLDDLLPKIRSAVGQLSAYHGLE
jgi:hypothetical protein